MFNQSQDSAKNGLDAVEVERLEEVRVVEQSDN